MIDSVKVRTTEQLKKDIAHGVYVLFGFVSVILFVVLRLFNLAMTPVYVILGLFLVRVAFVLIWWLYKYHAKENGLKTAYIAFKMISRLKREMLLSGVFTQRRTWFSNELVAKLPNVDYHVNHNNLIVEIENSAGLSNKLDSLDWSVAFGRYSVESQYLSFDSNSWILELDDVTTSHRIHFKTFDDYESRISNMPKYDILVDERLTYKLFHTLVVGQSGSGKSYFLNHLLLSFMLKGWRDVFIVDPKRSDMFNFGELFGRGHAAANIDEIIEMFDRLNKLIDERKSKMNRLLKKHDNVDYAYFKLKPIILVFDEYLSFQGKVKREKPDIRRKMEDLVSTVVLEGRQIGVFAVISMQKSGADSLPTEWRNQLRFKLLLGQSEDTDYITTFETQKPPKRLLNAGQGWYKLAGVTMAPKYAETPEIGFDMMPVARKLSERAESMTNSK